MEICAIRPLVDCQNTIQAMIISKRARLEKIMGYCREKEYMHTASYLENACGDMSTAIENHLGG